MPNITNKEWIDNNNLKIDDLITQASELPDYQDIEPIYSNENFSLFKTNLTYANNKYIISNLDNKYISYYISNNNPYHHYIAKVNNDGTITNLFYKQKEADGSTYSIELIDYDDEYLYLFDRSTNYR